MDPNLWGGSPLYKNDIFVAFAKLVKARLAFFD
jgi:hypothetical protein